MNNVYIGARYVPKFDGDWDNTKSYEALTIVQYGNNNYTSKKPVPVGTLPTDTNYWALTGNYNGMISHIEQEIADLKTRFNEINLSIFKDKTICIIGDSLSDETTQQPNWVDAFTEIVETVGATVNNISVSGSSVLGWGSSPANIPVGYDIYIIALGTNDFQGQFPQSSLLTAIQAIITRIDLSNPDRRAFYISAPKAFIPTFTDMYTPQTVYRHFFETVFAQYGCQIISGALFPNLSNLTNGVYVASDNIHLTPQYRYIYASHVLDVMISGSSETANAYSYAKACEIDDDLVHSSGNVALTWIDGNNFVLSLNLFGCELTALQWTPICKIANGSGNGLITELNEYTTSDYTGTILQWRVNAGNLEVAAPTTDTYTLVTKLTGSLPINPSMV